MVQSMLARLRFKAGNLDFPSELGSVAGPARSSGNAGSAGESSATIREEPIGFAPPEG
jgi:hypothetical protein